VHHGLEGEEQTVVA